MGFDLPAVEAIAAFRGIGIAREAFAANGGEPHGVGAHGSSGRQVQCEQFVGGSQVERLASAECEVLSVARECGAEQIVA